MSSFEIFPYFTEGTVVTGFGRGGKEIGVPTANFEEDVVQKLPANFECGVYYGWAKISDDDNVYRMVQSVGWNPYYKNTLKTMETHLMHKFDNDFYGKHLKVIVLGYIRPMSDFDSLDALIAAIQKDIAEANKLLEEPTCLKYKNHSFFSISPAAVVSGQAVITPTAVSGHTSTPATVSGHASTPATVTDHSSTPTAVSGHTNTPATVTDHSSTPATVSGHASTPATVPGHASTPAIVPDHASTPATVSGHASTPATVTDHYSTLTAVSGHTNTPATVTDHTRTPATVSGHDSTPTIHNDVHLNHDHTQSCILHSQNHNSSILDSYITKCDTKSNKTCDHQTCQDIILELSKGEPYCNNQEELCHVNARNSSAHPTRTLTHQGSGIITNGHSHNVDDKI